MKRDAWNVFRSACIYYTFKCIFCTISYVKLWCVSSSLLRGNFALFGVWISMHDSTLSLAVRLHDFMWLLLPFRCDHRDICFFFCCYVAVMLYPSKAIFICSISFTPSVPEGLKLLSDPSGWCVDILLMLYLMRWLFGTSYFCVLKHL